MQERNEPGKDSKSPYLIAIDLDGTLLSPAGRVSDRTRTAIQSVLSNGHRICFATGRNYVESIDIFDQAGHHDLCVVVSGAVIVDARSHEVKHLSTMTPQLARDLCKAVESLGQMALALQNKHATGFDYLVSKSTGMHRSLEDWFDKIQQRVESHDDLAGHAHEHTLRVSTVVDLEHGAQLRKVLAEQFAGRAYLHGVLVQDDAVEVIEMFDPNINKWTGLQHAARFHGISTDHVVAIGDDLNDLQMLTGASLGVAMGNARPEVKSAADVTIGSNADDGLAVFLEQWLRDPGQFPIKTRRSLI